ncbi:MAG TPA: hypothetical protein GX708_23375 [Gallicola sp.]|nr:hypothetical protein [Gallicola sp.]
MKKTIDKHDFVQEFRNYNREDNFSREGLEALFDYIEQYEEETGLEIELDVIAICCEYTEYENIQEFNENYGKECETIEDIEYYTQVIPLSGDGFIIQDF